MSLGYVPKYENAYWLVVARYSTGDSFHRAEGEFHFVHLFESRALAAQAVQKIKHHNEIHETLPDGMRRVPKGTDTRYTVHIEIENGVTIPIVPPWLGYFEYLNEVEIEQMYLVP